MSKKSSALKKKTPSEYVLYSIVFCIFCFFAFTYLYILFWCLISGLRDAEAVAVDPFGFSKLHFKNYIDVFTLMKANGTGFVQMTLNSMYFSILGCAINIMITSMFAYVCSKYRFPGSRLIYNIVIECTTRKYFYNHFRSANLIVQIFSHKKERPSDLSIYAGIPK